MYFFLKTAFYVYLFHPKTLGATVIFEKFLEPFLLKNEGKFEEAFKAGKKVLEE